MFRSITFFVALTVAGSAFAQDAPRLRKTHKAAPAAAEQPGEPADIAAVPRNVQKWIGGAVDDILTGADKAVDPGRGTR